MQKGNLASVESRFDCFAVLCKPVAKRDNYHTYSTSIFALPSLNCTGTSSSVLPLALRICGEPPSSLIFQPSMRYQPSPADSILLPTAARKYRLSAFPLAATISVRRKPGSVLLVGLGKSSTVAAPMP